MVRWWHDARMFYLRSRKILNILFHNTKIWLPISLHANESWYKPLRVVTMPSWLEYDEVWALVPWSPPADQAAGAPPLAAPASESALRLLWSTGMAEVLRPFIQYYHQCPHQRECPRVARRGLPNLRDVGLLFVHFRLRGQGPGRALRWPGPGLPGWLR